MISNISFRRVGKPLGYCLLGLTIIFLVGCAPRGPMGAPGYTKHNVLAFSPDGQFLADGKHMQNRVDLYKVYVDDTPQLEQMRTLEGDSASIKTVRSVAWSPDGTQLATAGLDDIVVIWDPQTGEETRRFPDLIGVEALTFLPDGSSIAMAGPDSLVRIWDIENNTLITELRGHTAPVLAIDASENGDLIATAGSDQTIRLWRTQDWSLMQVLEGHQDPVLSVDFSPDGTLLLTSSNGTDIRLWKTTNNIDEKETPVTDVAAITASMEEESQVSEFVLVLATAASIAATGSPGIYGGPAMRSGGKGQRPTFFNCPAKFSPDGKQIAFIQQSDLFSRGSHHIDVLDAKSLKPIKRFDAYIGALDYHPSGTFLAAAGPLMLELLEPSTGKVY